MKRRVPLGSPLDLAETVGLLRHGLDDPTVRISGREVLRATRTPEGPATLHLRAEAEHIQAEAWGPGAAWCLERVPSLIGECDDRASFAPAHPRVARWHHDHPGLRLPRTGRLLEALVPAVLQQRVTGFEGVRAYHQMVRRWGEAAPGPGELMVPPSAEALAAIPYYELHVVGVDKRRADTLRRAAVHAGRLEVEGPDLTDAYERLRSIPGIGPWTSAEAGLRAWGDADAVSVGDHDLKHVMCWALAGEARASDVRMLELLEPFAGHRGRVCRLALLAGARRPGRALRRRVEPIARR
ncbi:MAG: DNA-3-methyladenine glycosylase [Acidimicrobiia bacterium]